jgi:hypothetical protein
MYKYFIKFVIIWINFILYLHFAIYCGNIYFLTNIIFNHLILIKKLVSFDNCIVWKLNYFFFKYNLWKPFLMLVCCNRSLGLATKARACKVVGQERKHGNESKCEGMNPHTPKGASTLRIGVSVDFWMFRERLQGSKPNRLRSSLYH